eukprot:PhM_4_TR12656/c0_g1_i1/m.44494
MMRLTPRRCIRYSTIDATLKPVPGQSAGQLSMYNEISLHPDYDEENKRPVWRHEVMPLAPEHNYFATMYKWGYNSLTLFKKINEDPGPWWNSSNTGLVSVYTQLGEYGAAGMWSGVWRHTFGLGNYNLFPSQLYKRAYGRRDKNGAVVFDSKETIKTPIQKSTFPHTKEHDAHKRFKNPQLPGFSDIDAVHGKRVLREVQYHLGQGLRFYLVDGVFGSNPETATPFRIFTDNATHGYFAAMNAIRNRHICSFHEMSLLKRAEVNPLDEWAWRRPGVLLYHAAGFDFEQPRIVEEFGGPRPQDLGLKTQKFQIFDPYSIPMKGIVGAEPKCATMLESLAFLCGRWGFYADDKKFLTLPSDSILGPDGVLTLVVNPTEENATILRNSNYLYGAQHHRATPLGVARAWDGVSRASSSVKATAYGDLVEQATGMTHSPLTTRIGASRDSLSHRLFGRRRLGEYGYKRPHNYSTEGTVPRPQLVPLSSTRVLFVSDDASSGISKVSSAEAAGNGFAASLAKSSLLYAEQNELSAVFASTFSSVPCYVVNAKDTKSVFADLASTGKLNTDKAKEAKKGSFSA